VHSPAHAGAENGHKPFLHGKYADKGDLGIARNGGRHGKNAPLQGAREIEKMFEGE